MCVKMDLDPSTDQSSLVVVQGRVINRAPQMSFILSPKDKSFYLFSPSNEPQLFRSSLMRRTVLVHGRCISVAFLRISTYITG